MSPARRRRPRVASVQVLGRPLRQPERNAERALLLRTIIDALCTRPSWAPLDALLLPASFFRLASELGPLEAPDRAASLEASEIASACLGAAARLADKFGAVLVVGSDTIPYRGTSGDQFMAAWGPNGVIGSARKVFPSKGDAAPTKGGPYVLFDQDADDRSRVIRLDGGSKALLCVCYDAFAFSELARGPTSSRSAMRYIGDAKGRWQELQPEARNAMLARFAGMIESERPTTALIVKRRRRLTPRRRPTLTPLALRFAVARRRSAEPLAERSA